MFVSKMPDSSVKCISASQSVSEIMTRVFRQLFPNGEYFLKLDRAHS